MVGAGPKLVLEPVLEPLVVVAKPELVLPPVGLPPGPELVLPPVGLAEPVLPPPGGLGLGTQAPPLLGLVGTASEVLAKIAAATVRNFILIIPVVLIRKQCEYKE